MINDGGPAYPQQPVYIDRGRELEWADGWGYGGMTLRDWFAGQALTGMTHAYDYGTGPCNADIAARAYAIADAMLKTRSIE